MPKIPVISPSWKGFSEIRHLVIFGDSYSDVGFRAEVAQHPTVDQPLAVDFPGITFTEPDTPNWVGHLITEHISHGPVLVYDYAVGGDAVDGVHEQINEVFLPGAGSKPEWAPWSATDTLFITWVGINDCGDGDDANVRDSVLQLIEAQERLHKAGGRNFLLIDVPPIHRSPIGRALSGGDESGSLVYKAWNSQLLEGVERFSETHPDASVMLFSSWDTFTRVLDEPASHGFAAADVSKSRGDIWVDHLHPTSKMHDWIAKDLAEFLVAQPRYEEIS